jgi:hypothetical protein
MTAVRLRFLSVTVHRGLRSRCVDQGVLVVEGRSVYRGEVVKPFAEPGERGGDGRDVLALEPLHRARVGGDLGDGGVGEALHLLEPQRGQARVGAPVLDDGAQDGGAGLPQPGSGGNPGAQRGGGVGRISQPGRRGGVALGHGAADQLGQDGVLAVEVEIEGAPGDSCRGEDIADGEVAEVAIGEQATGSGQDGLAQVAAGSGRAAATLPAGGPPGT